MNSTDVSSMSSSSYLEVNATTSTTTESTTVTNATLTTILQQLAVDLITSKTTQGVSISSSHLPSLVSSSAIPPSDAGVLVEDLDAATCSNKTLLESINGIDGETNSIDTFLYIAVIVSFYAVAMVILMIRYIRHESKDTECYFSIEDYVKHESSLEDVSVLRGAHLNVSQMRGALDSLYKQHDYQAESTV